MSRVRYLKDKIRLYLLFSCLVVAFSLIVLLLPYDTIYLRDRAYLTTFLVTIILCVGVFLVGTLHNFLVWMQGRGLAGSPEGRLVRVMLRSLRYVTRRVGRAFIVFREEAFYLPKLKDKSTTRWAMHILILGGFVLMLILDIVVTVSLDIARYQPMIASDGWAKLWIRDFAFDLVGLMMLLGLVIAAVRRFVLRPKIVKTELPDAASILFLLAVVLGGFILEGMGIAARVPGHESANSFSFVGQVFAALTPVSFAQYYDQAWLIHGVMSALLIAYIPFSRLFHMIATPIAIEYEKLVTAGARR